MSDSYYKKTPDELRRIMDTSPPDTPAYIKARDALLSRSEPLKAYVYQPYPRALYHWKFGTKTVQSEEEENVLLRDKGWVDSPAKVWKPKRLYHPTLKPDGHVFESPEEETEAVNKGWVDSPAKFSLPAPIPPSHGSIERFARVVAIIGGLAAFVWTLIQIWNWASKRP